MLFWSGCRRHFVGLHGSSRRIRYSIATGGEGNIWDFYFMGEGGRDGMGSQRERERVCEEARGKPPTHTEKERRNPLPDGRRRLHRSRKQLDLRTPLARTTSP